MLLIVCPTNLAHFLENKKQINVIKQIIRRAIISGVKLPLFSDAFEKSNTVSVRQPGPAIRGIDRGNTEISSCSLTG
jgi:hypothetical protein